MIFALLVDLIYQPTTNVWDMLDTLNLIIQTKKTMRPLDLVVQLRAKTTTATAVAAVASGAITAPTNHHVNAMVRKKFRGMSRPTRATHLLRTMITTPARMTLSHPRLNQKAHDVGVVCIS